MVMTLDCEVSFELYPEVHQFQQGIGIVDAVEQCGCIWLSLGHVMGLATFHISPSR